MSKYKVVRFIDGKARIITTDNLLSFKEDKNTFHDPDLSACKGVPPELWNIVDGKIMPHTKEKQEDLKKILHSGINKNPEIERLKKQLKFYKAAAIILALLSVLAPLLRK